MLREHENSTDLRFGGPPRQYECSRICLLFQLISVIPAFDPLYFGLFVTRAGFEPAPRRTCRHITDWLP